MCQRATGSVSIAFKNVKQADVEWDHEPDWYDSSPIGMRSYCRECGTSLGFNIKEGSGKMDLTVASFDDPSRFSPNIISAPRASSARGSTPTACRRSAREDYQPLVEKWVAATGQNARVTEVQIHLWTASDGVELA